MHIVLRSQGDLFRTIEALEQEEEFGAQVQ